MQYSSLTAVYDKLAATSKRLMKTAHIARFLEDAGDDISEILLLLQGRVFPAWDERKVGVSSKTVVKAIVLSTGASLKKVEDTWRELGDLGDVAESLTRGKTQSTLFTEKLDVSKVYSNIRSLAKIGGKGSVDWKVKTIAQLLTSADPTEAKYITRTVLEDLRVGVADGTLRDAIVWTFFSDKAEISSDPKSGEVVIGDRETYNDIIKRVQEAYDMTNDFAKVFCALRKDGLEGLLGLTLELGVPIKVMLAQKAVDIPDAFNRVGSPAAFEYKYDGFRVQVHKSPSGIRLFTRRLEEVTDQFPDILPIIEQNVKVDSCIIDCEVVGYDSKTYHYLPFQSISQRIRRKYDIQEMAVKFPVELKVFDIISDEQRSVISMPFLERRKILESIINPVEHHIGLSQMIVSDDLSEVETMFAQSRKAGNEGLMAKKLDAPYKPGSRVGFMVKLKGTMDNLELVIVRAEWGEGKRVNWFSSFTLACVDEDGNFREIGKVGTGIKEKSPGVSFTQLTGALQPLILSEEGREVRVKPQVVVEVAYEEIQKSSTYASGYALRFPRIIALREDKAPDVASDLTYVEDLYYDQGKR